MKLQKVITVVATVIAAIKAALDEAANYCRFEEVI